MSLTLRIRCVEGTFATNVAYGRPDMKTLYITEVESTSGSPPGAVRQIYGARSISFPSDGERPRVDLEAGRAKLPRVGARAMLGEHIEDGVRRDRRLDAVLDVQRAEYSAPNRAVAAAISVPGDAERLAPAAMIAVTSSEMFGLMSSSFMRVPVGAGPCWEASSGRQTPGRHRQDR